MNEEHVHDLAYTAGENPDVFCVDFRCGFGLSEKEVFARLNEWVKLKKATEVLSAEMARINSGDDRVVYGMTGLYFKNALKAYADTLEGK